MFVADDSIAYDPAAIEKVLIKNEKQGLTLIAGAKFWRWGSESEWNGECGWSADQGVL